MGQTRSAHRISPQQDSNFPIEQKDVLRNAIKLQYKLKCVDVVLTKLIREISKERINLADIISKEEFLTRQMEFANTLTKSLNQKVTELTEYKS